MKKDDEVTFVTKLLRVVKYIGAVVLIIFLCMLLAWSAANSMSKHLYKALEMAVSNGHDDSAKEILDELQEEYPDERWSWPISKWVKKGEQLTEADPALNWQDKLDQARSLLAQGESNKAAELLEQVSDIIFGVDTFPEYKSFLGESLSISEYNKDYLLPAAKETLEKLEQTYKAGGDMKKRAQALKKLEYLYKTLEDNEKLAETFEKLEQTYEAGGDKKKRTKTLKKLEKIYKARGDKEKLAEVRKKQEEL